jgi:hypothetical protein
MRPRRFFSVTIMAMAVVVGPGHIAMIMFYIERTVKLKGKPCEIKAMNIASQLHVLFLTI